MKLLASLPPDGIVNLTQVMPTEVMLEMMQSVPPEGLLGLIASMPLKVSAVLGVGSLSVWPLGIPVSFCLSFCVYICLFLSVPLSVFMCVPRSLSVRLSMTDMFPSMSLSASF